MKHAISRRDFALASLGASASVALAQTAQTSSRADASRLSMPGLFRGRVVAVHHPADAVPAMFERGMRELTGAPDKTAAWKLFFEPGDVVGIKLNPVGMPYVINRADVTREIIAGLESAGVKRRDIVVYDRYRAQFLKAGFDKFLPQGVRWTAAAEDYENIQLAMEGYDPDHYMDMALVQPGQVLNSPTHRRSYAARFISKEVNKLINVPLLKDHQSAGVTLALKNLSHGLVNNVRRSHSSNTLNACGAFIPAVVAMPVIRNKTVLHIMEGILGLYHGGPGSNNRKQFVWNHHTLYFATDPVAMDRVGWDELDRKRVSVGMKKIAEDLPDSFSTFLRRQPEHVEIAGAMGLGEWDEKKIELRKVSL
ncbi:MAG: DUF362 domain-containing protein [Acidimicrobiia bacterium]|nr:DUF362 domain-containing protein [Acidimicrobiia bacterium]